MTSTIIETASATQYVIFSGMESAVDVQRIVGRLTDESSVTFSYRHTSVVNARFLDLLIIALRAKGITEIATIFADEPEVSRIKALAVREHISYTAK